MANVSAIHSVGSSLVSWLKSEYPSELNDEFSCDFRLVSSSEMDDLKPNKNVVSIYLYRVAVDEHLRAVRHTGVRELAKAPLSLDLYYMFSVWSDDAAEEHTIIAWLMRQLHRQPILDKALLGEEGGWRADELVQLIPADLSNEDMMRIWDTLQPDYRLSVSYIARAVRIDDEEMNESLGPRVIEKQFEYGQSS